jgi:hypothetical protein
VFDHSFVGDLDRLVLNTLLAGQWLLKKSWLGGLLTRPSSLGEIHWRSSQSRQPLPRSYYLSTEATHIESAIGRASCVARGVR